MAPNEREKPSSEDRMESLLVQLVQGLKDAAIKPEQIREIMQGVGESIATSTQKALKPENPVFPGVSVFAPTGKVAKADVKLKRTTYFCGNKEDEDRLTPQEIDAYNAFTEPRETRGGSWRAEIKRARSINAKEELWIWVPNNTVDHRMMLPCGLALILNELNGGPSTENVMELLRQIAALKAMVLSTGKTAIELEAALVSA